MKTNILTLSISLLLVSSAAYSQTKSETYMNGILEASIETPLPKGAKAKVVDFKDYSISGYFLKKKPLENKMIEISNADGNTILYGIYKVIDGKSAVHGRYDYESGDRKSSVYGTFYVSNGAGELIMKPRKASELSVTNGKVEIWSGYYQRCHAELIWISNMFPRLFIRDGNKAWYYRSFSAEVTQAVALDQNYKNVDIEDLLLSDTLRVEIEWHDNTKFSGHAFGKRDNNDHVCFTLLDGEKTDKAGQKNIVSWYSHWRKSAKCTFTAVSPENLKIREKSYYLPDTMKNICLDSLFNEQYYWGKSPEIAVTYSNGDKYVGSFKMENGEVVNSTGMYTYAGGDMFVGDLSGEYFASVPINGKMLFKDGKEEEGNWLDDYELTEEQYAFICKEYRAPSYIRNIALSFYNRNKAAALVAKAKSYEKRGNFKKAKEAYLQAQHYEYSSSVDSILKGIEDKVERQELIEKYGSRYADNIINKKIEVGMTKEMCEIVLAKTAGMEFYRKSSWSDFSGNTIETWEYDFDYGLAKAKDELYKETVDVFGEDGEEASAGEKVAAALLSEAITGFAGTFASPLAGAISEYKYLKFKNFVLVELNNADNERKKSNALNILDLFF